MVQNRTTEGGKHLGNYMAVLCSVNASGSVALSSSVIASASVAGTRYLPLAANPYARSHHDLELKTRGPIRQFDSAGKREVKQC
jgi:hypothetical protein